VERGNARGPRACRCAIWEDTEAGKICGDEQPRGADPALVHAGVFQSYLERVS
jgi:hypothetical protein